MATSHFSATIPQPTSRRSTTTNPFFRSSAKAKIPPPPLKVRQTLKWVVRERDTARPEQSLSEPTTSDDVQELVDFLYEDLPHVFDDQGIDETAYDEHIKYRDPITKHDSKSGYLFNIAMLRKLFGSHYLQLHWIKQTGPYEITTRWTMTMKFLLLPWKPELVFTGNSVMGINPETKKFCSHVDGNLLIFFTEIYLFISDIAEDCWDSIQNNDYFSVEGLLYVVKQLRYYKTPDLETPKYQILKKTANYEVRSYEPFIVVETNGDKLSGSSGFSSIARYIFGKNLSGEKIPVTPVFTQAFDPEISKVSIQIVLPSGKDMSSLPAPNQSEVNLRKVEGGIAAVSKFSGKPIEDIVREKEKALRSNLVRDNLKPKAGCLLAHYNDPAGRTWSFIMRNEVLIWLEEFSLD